MSLKTRFKNLGNILAEDEAQTDVFVLESPVLTNGMYAAHARRDRRAARRGDRLHHAAAGAGAPAGDALRASLDRIRAEAEDAALRGCATIVLTDERLGPGPRRRCR